MDIDKIQVRREMSRQAEVRTRLGDAPSRDTFR